MTQIQSITPKTAQEWLEKGEAVLVDVRQLGEHLSEKVSCSICVPHDRASVSDLEHGKGKRIILMCHSGRRSMMACEKLVQEGVDAQLWNLEGGMVAWKQSGLPTESSGRKMLPLDRQVQLTIGLMILTGLGLGVYVHPAGLILPLIAGLGLTNAGVTGWCGLALAMAKAPWNRG